MYIGFNQKKVDRNKMFLRSSKAKICNLVLLFSCDGVFRFNGSNKLNFEGRSMN